MSRRFRDHELRTVLSLDGIWDFAFLGGVDPEATEPKALVYDDHMAVPACFDATPAYAGKRGLAAYRTFVDLPAAPRHRLYFGAVHNWCRVFVNGREVGRHVGGFTRFGVDLPPGSAGRVELAVLVDNRFDYARCPLHLDYFDWYQFGGLARSVELHALGDVWIDRLQTLTTALARPAVEVSIHYEAPGARGPVPLKVSFDGKTVLEESVRLPEPRGRLVRTIELPGASLWSPEDPNLHMLGVRLGADDTIERIGLRQVRVRGRELLLNDRPLRLLGFNRHESHPQFGHAQPDALLVADLQQIRELGCNFIRGSHYPQEPRFLDLCDEHGICVWSESIGWQHTVEHLNDPAFLDAQRRHGEEMVAAATNHPCVIMWGILNESESRDERSRAAYADLFKRLRALDPSRPVTYASSETRGDVLFDLADIVAFNLYPGWYFGRLDEVPALLDERFGELTAGPAADKPILLSEIGAGAVPGWRDRNEERWTEQYQARLLECVIGHLFGGSRDKACGLSIWLYNDFRTVSNVRRPRGFNDKGVVDEYRRPKLAYATVQKAFRALRGLPPREE